MVKLLSLKKGQASAAQQESRTTHMKPEHIRFSQINQYKKKHPEMIIDNRIDLAIDELFDIEYPAKKDSKQQTEVESFGAELTNNNLEAWGEWVYYPWLNKVVHFPPKDKLRALRTSRNRNLVTTGEQKQLYGATILIIGMSVGSNVVEALVSQGIGGKLLLVDMDDIEPSNLNRIRSPYHHVGLPKVEAISRKVWEVDPYIEIVPYNDGLNESNLSDMLDEHQVDVVVDEMDELCMKIRLREEAKQRHLPVAMAADDGDNALVDIERYDLEPELELFGGRIPAEILEKIKNEKIPRAELGMIIGRYFVGADNIPLRMYQSLQEVGKTLPSWPQLGGAAALSGLAIAYAVKQIVLGKNVQTGRSLVSLDEKLGGNQLTPAEEAELANYKTMMGGSHES